MALLPLAEEEDEDEEESLDFFETPDFEEAEDDSDLTDDSRRVSSTAAVADAVVGDADFFDTADDFELARLGLDVADDDFLEAAAADDELELRRPLLEEATDSEPELLPSGLLLLLFSRLLRLDAELLPLLERLLRLRFSSCFSLSSPSDSDEADCSKALGFF